MAKRNKNLYGGFRSLAFMGKSAWKARRRVLIFAVLLAAAGIGIQTMQLYIAPEIIKQVETRASLPALLGTTLFFAAGLFFLHMLQAYLENLNTHGRLEVRAWIRDRILAKMHTTAYPNACDPKILNMRKNALATTADESSAAERVFANGSKLLINLGTTAIYLTVLSHVNLWLALLILVMTICATLVAKYHYSWEYRHREERGQLMNRLEYLRDKAESVPLAKEVRIFGLKPWLDSIYRRAVRDYARYILKKETAMFRANLADIVVITARIAISYGYLIHLALTEGMSAAEFLLYFNAVSGFSLYINNVFTALTDLYRDTLEISLVQEYLELPEPFNHDNGLPIPDKIRPELQLQHVSYRYPGADRDTLHDFTLTIRPGENLAIVGLNGAGKTTLVKLLCGLLDPDEGQVLLDGVDIRRYDRAAYYRLFSAVFQEYSLLDVTIAENITGTGQEMDFPRVMDCIEKAGLTKKVESLPQGIHTHIGKDVYPDGILLSGGQTQRLLLARALYKDGMFLLLDEPTAALDPIAEDDIYRKYHEMTEGKTSIFISHRLASTRFCDRILFLADGNIAEAGTHEELLARDGAYAALYQIQSHYYAEQEAKNDEES